MSFRTLGSFSTWEALVSERMLARAQAYLADNRVQLLRPREPSVVRGEVAGPITYACELEVQKDGRLRTSCTCARGREDRICAHVVATGLRVQRELGKAAPETMPRRLEARQVADYLETLDAPTLRALLSRAAASDEVLTDKLLDFRATALQPGLDGLRAAVIDITTPAGMLNWQEADEYARGLQLLAALLERHIDEDGDSALVELIEDAIVRSEAALERMDASNGKVEPAIKALQQVHRKACATMYPNPRTLGARLAELAASSQLGVYSEVLPEYVDALDTCGLAAYCNGLKEAEGALPASSDADSELTGARRERIAAALKELAAMEAYRAAMSRIGRKRKR